jgi:hypothetical protein
MSILQDLDPQYAKIHAQPSTPRKLIIAASVTLLVLAGGYWGVLQTRATPASPTPAPAADSTPSSPNLAVEPKQPATALAATIREEAQRTPGTEQRTTMPQGVPENAAGSLADAEYRRQTQALPAHAKTTANPAPAKPEHRNVTPQPTAKSGKSQASPGKRTNERDIDIITAIVR